MSVSKRVQEIFDHAIKIDADDARLDYVKAECGRNRELETEVLNLIKAYRDAGEFLDQPFMNVNSSHLEHNSNDPDSAVGTHVGPFKIVRLIGEGGFGLVYEAIQQESSNRRVALKIIKPGMDSKDVISRFNIERHALSLMNHPAIAQIYVAGETKSGRPYFAMELSSGKPIAEYCNERQLSIEERIKLFHTVCAGVHHAHQIGIIHRDLKPNNILVDLVEGMHIPKIIDFGIAKAIEPSVAELLGKTNGIRPVGTPIYMSPEQAKLESRKVDVRSDIFSLGVIFCELITGRTPLNDDELKDVDFSELLEKLTENNLDHPDRLAAKLMVSNSSPEFAEDPSKTKKRIQGDLGWIICKAIQVDLDQRYVSADALMRDLDRYLNRDPVDAGPPSQTYRLKKFAAKHKWPLAMSATVFVALALSTWISAWQAIKAQRLSETEAKQKQAVKKLLEEATTARNAEAAKRKQAESAFKLFEYSLTRADPFKDGRDVTVVEVLEKAQASIEQFGGDDDLVKAMLLNSISKVLQHLGQYDLSQDTAEKAYSLAVRQLPKDHDDVFDIRTHLATAYIKNEDYRQAVVHLDGILNDDLEGLSADHPKIIQTTIKLAKSKQMLGNFDEAIQLFESTLTACENTLDTDDPIFQELCVAYSGVLAHIGDQNRAYSLLQKNVEWCERKFGSEHLITASAINDLAMVELYRGNSSSSIKRLKTCLEIRERLLGEDHPDTIGVLSNLGTAYGKSKNYLQGVKILERAERLSQANPNISDEVKMKIQASLGSGYFLLGRLADSKKASQAACEFAILAYGDDHFLSAVPLNNMGAICLRLGEVDEAIDVLEKAYEIRINSLGDKHVDSLKTHFNLAKGYLMKGRDAEATQMFDSYLELSQQKYSKALKHAEDLRYVAVEYLKNSNFELADKHLNHLQDFLTEHYADSWMIFDTMSFRGLVALNMSKSLTDEEPGESEKWKLKAESLLVDGFEGLEERAQTVPAPIRPRRMSECIERLVDFYKRTQNEEKLNYWKNRLAKLAEQ